MYKDQVSIYLQNLINSDIVNMPCVAGSALMAVCVNTPDCLKLGAAVSGLVPAAQSTAGCFQNTRLLQGQVTQGGPSSAALMITELESLTPS